ncbi:MAG: ribose 5-phosphate isomerase B [Rhodospirillaceae bacterium]|jgi:ribose 5-phosphate isomerase B|nr:ribose 5-phosphate isomerase B [Rhodospirillaceae bacterium]MBT3886749.1 ribose 5-phosphate isomerase B [Rhodospirillaceae bacterium]MBT4115098.1 ribose 5-phosphate isomerase B [Rhodospirillaceae bacterium]MBT4674320.1 ribose 5-phosphate isomerase B [Rhodospirillaceae bacterium]MBT4721155.1 ribose 5-phosphate isomerase B [Rhodospirillaceae bacterium]
MNQTIAIGSDHAGFALKESLVETLTQLGYAPLDLGTNGPDSVDYPDFAHAMAGALGAGKADKGVLICGSGIGISMAANRHPDVRAALVHDALGARMCRQHNDANVIVFGGRMIGIEVARDCLEIFLKTEFEGGRHQRRIDKITPA